MEVICKTATPCKDWVPCGYTVRSARYPGGISGGIPIDLLAVESANIRAGSTGVATAKSLRKRCRELTIVKWQERWINSSKGRWTYKLIPELQR